MAVALRDIFVLGVCTAGPRRVLSGSQRVFVGFLAVLGRFSAYSQRILGGFRPSWRWVHFKFLERLKQPKESEKVA